MAAIDELVKDFLAQKRIAVAGVSENSQQTANFIYRTLRQKGYEVFAVNPKAAAAEGDPVYPNLRSLPKPVDGLVIVTPAAASEGLVRECVESGIRRVWMHNLFGTRPRFGKGLAARIGSVSPEAVRICRENGIAVIPGSCPMQFAGDPGHACLRGVLRVVGALAV